jgi:hypothetical protein
LGLLKNTEVKNTEGISLGTCLTHKVLQGNEKPSKVFQRLKNV